MGLLDGISNGWRDVFVGTTGPGTQAPRRSRVRFVGGVVSEDTTNDQTVVDDGTAEDAEPIGPAGDTNDAQFHGLDGRFSASNKLWGDAFFPEGEVFHEGRPTHEEEFVDFKAHADIFAVESTHSRAFLNPLKVRGQGRTQWNHFQTSNATPTYIQSIRVAAGSASPNVFVTVTWEVTVGAISGGGGNMVCKAVFKRVGGVLERVGPSLDLADPGHLTIVASVEAVVRDNARIGLQATGIASTLNWFVTAHIQYAIIPLPNERAPVDVIVMTDSLRYAMAKARKPSDTLAITDALSYVML